MILSEGLNSDEIKIRKKLDKYLLGQNESSNNRPEDAESIAALRRFQAKLKLRETKRLRHLKLFDIDSYTNELIDRERANKPTKDQQQDEDVIFEFKTLKTNMYDANISVKPEVIEVTRVLDRFKSKNHHHVMMNQRENFYFLNRMPIGMVEWRNEDVKCIFSPFTNKMLKPYIWRDFKTMPPRLEINNEMKKRGKKESDEMKSSSPIDYVYLRPEHVLPINMMCEEHFWNGIDISECLQYPDLTIVALYKKLIIGFALLTPPSTQSSTTTINENKEMYLSFIFVHPDWREAKRKSTQKSGADQHVSIAQYMLYYLIKKCDCDVILHVSVNSPAVILYQKFGFQIEEFIQDFYDKYYSSEQNRSKDAFLMKFSR